MNPKKRIGVIIEQNGGKKMRRYQQRITAIFLIIFQIMTFVSPISRSLADSQTLNITINSDSIPYIIFQ